MPIVLIAVLFGASATALATASCGSNMQRKPRHDTPSAPSIAAARGAGMASSGEGSYLHYDNDDDERTIDRPGAGNDDREQLAAYPQVAGPEQHDAIATTVKRYFDAAVHGNVTEACALLTSVLATQLARQDRSCPASLTRLFGEERALLATESSPRLLGAYLHGGIGLALLGFRAAPELMIPIEKEGNRWKFASPFGSPPA